ncbi:hypothetical protein N9B90_01545 [bacterium]|nr:hypothetical protein [bacterium]
MILDPIALMVGGFIAATPVIVRRKPNLKTFADKLAPWKGTAGLTLLILGTITTIRMVAVLVNTSAPLFLLMLATSVAQIGLGILLGTPHLKRLPIPALQSPQANNKLDQWRLFVTPYTTRLGFGAIAVGLVLLFA